MQGGRPGSGRLGDRELMTRTLLWRWLAGAVAVAAIVFTATAMLRQPPAPTAPPIPATTTAAVSRGTVTERVLVSGQLSFDGPATITHHGQPGIITSVPAPGTFVARGGTLYAVADQPVRLLFGTLPAYRDLAEGVADGADVLQLKLNLAALRMRPGTVDRRFTAATAAAVRRWQAALHEPRTGRVPLGAVVFAPAPLRIAEIQVQVGETLQPDQPVLAVSSTDRVVTARLPTNRQYQVHVGDRVHVTISGVGSALPGMVNWIGRVATATTAADQTPQDPTVAVTVQVDLPDTAAGLDQTPAQVAITTRHKDGVLLVPVAALLARPGGGYQVRLSTGAFVTVELGLFDSTNATVEVTGELTEGQLVQVPAL